VGEHLLAALHSESVKALAAQLQQLFALGVAQLLAAHQVVGASLVAGDAVAGKYAAHHPLYPLGVVLDLGHVFAQDPPGDVLCWGRTAAAQQFHQHHGLVDMAHAHPLGDVVPEALVSLGVFRHAPMPAPDA
jgi:hypothetical protein